MIKGLLEKLRGKSDSIIEKSEGMRGEYCIYIDAGHGSDTPGKRSPKWEDGRQLFEWEFNREIAYSIMWYLVEHYPDVDFKSTFYSIIDNTLESRVEIANNDYNEFDESLFLSIHANAGGGTGWEVYTSRGETKSDDYASIFMEETQKQFPHMRFRRDYTDGDPDKEANFYVLKNTHMPAVLTENFFMDTLDPDCEILMSKEGKEKIVKAHCEALDRIIKTWEDERKEN